MFKKHIVFIPDMDVAAQMDSLEAQAVRHGLDNLHVSEMRTRVQDALVDLHREDSEASAYGIEVGITRTITSDDYNVTLELRPRNRQQTRTKRGPFSWLFSR